MLYLTFCSEAERNGADLAAKILDCSNSEMTEFRNWGKAGMGSSTVRT